MLDEYDSIADHYFLGYMDEFDGHQIVIALRGFFEWRGIRRLAQTEKRLTRDNAWSIPSSFVIRDIRRRRGCRGLVAGLLEQQGQRRGHGNIVIYYQDHRLFSFAA